LCCFSLILLVRGIVLRAGVTTSVPIFPQVGPSLPLLRTSVSQETLNSFRFVPPLGSFSLGAVTAFLTHQCGQSPSRAFGLSRTYPVATRSLSVRQWRPDPQGFPPFVSSAFPNQSPPICPPPFIPPVDWRGSLSLSLRFTTTHHPISEGTAAGLLYMITHFCATNSFRSLFEVLASQ